MRGAAIALQETDLEQFLTKMAMVARITLGSEQRRDSGGSPRRTTEEVKDQPQKKDDFLGLCLYCKTKGHRIACCPVLKSKQSKVASPSATVRGPATPAVAAVEPATTQGTAEDVATVIFREQGPVIQSSQPFVIVSSLEGESCKLSALLDTGSPVSFLKIDCFDKFVKSRDKLLVSTRRFRNISKETLSVLGSVKTRVTFELFGAREFNIELFVIGDGLFETDLIIGREFLDKERFTYIYKSQLLDSKTNPVTLFAQLPLNIEIEERDESLQEQRISTTAITSSLSSRN